LLIVSECKTYKPREIDCSTSTSLTTLPTTVPTTITGSSTVQKIMSFIILITIL